MIGYNVYSLYSREGGFQSSGIDKMGVGIVNGTFHQRLSQLRKKQRVSQRKVASDLYISQALLSHYENGIREPGLDFVNRVCEYYDVTADFLLGRSSIGGNLDEDAENGTQTVESLHKLLHTVANFEDKALVEGMLQCFSAISYKLLRHMAVDAQTLKVPQNRAFGLSDLAFHRGEMQVLDALEKRTEEDLPAGLETLLNSFDNQMSKHLEETR